MPVRTLSGSTREQVRVLIERAIKALDDNEGLGVVMQLLGHAIVVAATPYALTDQ